MAILAKKSKKNTTLVAISITTEIVIKKRQIAELAERSKLQLLYRYNGCKAVANNGEGWKTAFRVTEKSSLTCLIHWIQELGRVSGLKLLLTYMNF